MRRYSKHLIIAFVGLAGLVLGVTQAVGSSGSAPSSPGEVEASQAAQSPFTSYRQPTGTDLSDGTLNSAAYQQSTLAGDTEPTSVKAIDTTYEDAVKVLDPRTTLGPPSSAGEASYRQSGVVVIILHGEFVLNAPTLNGGPEPSGSFLSLVLDSHTGHIDFRGIEGSEPANLASLGPARLLG